MRNLFSTKNGVSLSLALLIAAMAPQPSFADGSNSTANTGQYEIIYPKAQFDPAQAAAMLAEGTATIEGRLYNTLDITGRSMPGLVESQRSAVAGVKIRLYPATQHFVEWQKSDAKQRSKFNDAPLVKLVNIGKRPKAYRFDDRVVQYRLETTSDQNGNFSFPKLLPGKYYLYSEARIEGSFMGTEVIGRTTYTNGYGQVVAARDETRPKEHFWFRELAANKYVDVKPNKSNIEANLKLK